MGGIVKVEDLKDLIIEIRGQNVWLDSDVAQIYGVETKRIVAAKHIACIRTYSNA